LEVGWLLGQPISLAVNSEQSSQAGRHDQVFAFSVLLKKDGNASQDLTRRAKRLNMTGPRLTIEVDGYAIIQDEFPDARRLYCGHPLFNGEPNDEESIFLVRR
jgi:hypothetical protein